MLTENNLTFLNEKIQALRSALFFNTSNAVLKFPTCIISTLRVDEAGQIWFFVRRPEQYLHEFDKAFPARLEYFQKGKRFYLHLTGKAYIITDPEELNEIISVEDDVKQTAKSQMVLIKFKVANADYFEQLVPGQTIVQKMRSQLSRLLFREKGFRPYRLQPSY